MNKNRGAMKRILIIAFITLLLPILAYTACTDNGLTLTPASLALSDVQDCVTDAEVGDTILLTGTSTWGAAASQLAVNKVITIDGQNSTTITISNSANNGWTAAIISISAAATVKSMTINGSSSVKNPAFTVSTANDWRITDITYTGGSIEGYFMYVAGVYGLLDNCSITGGNGSSELVFARGPTDSWTTANSLGGADNLFIEENTFAGSGYVTDINSNGRAVVRFNTISGKMKIDGHGLASNSPANGVRHMEIYGNTWTSASTFFPSIEVRGGTGFIFNNLSPNTDSSRLLLMEYCSSAVWANCDSECKCVEDRPITDMIGRGINNTDVPMYLWNNSRNSSDWTEVSYPPGEACVTACGGDFDILGDIIQSDDDYYRGGIVAQSDSSTPFDGQTGVGFGTLERIPATCAAGRGYWANDQGSWNSSETLPVSNPGEDGVFYSCDAGGDAWSVAYTPYTYPHPLREAAAAVPSNAIQGVTIN